MICKTPASGVCGDYDKLFDGHEACIIVPRSAPQFNHPNPHAFHARRPWDRTFWAFKNIFAGCIVAANRYLGDQISKTGSYVMTI